MTPHEAGRFFHLGWEMRFHIQRLSSEGNLSGNVEILRGGHLRCRLVSSGVFKTPSALIAGLKATGLSWLASQGGAAGDDIGVALH